MNERYVSTHARRVNRRKRARDPPLASIGNVTAPVHPISINERTFRNSYLPVALANKWVEIPQLVQGVSTIDLTGNSGKIDIPDDLYNIALFYVTVPDVLPTNYFEFEIVYYDNTVKHFRSGDFGSENKGVEWAVQITPICISCLPSEDTKSVPGSEELRFAEFTKSNIKTIELYDGLEFTQVFHNQMFLYGTTLYPTTVTARDNSLWYPLH